MAAQMLVEVLGRIRPEDGVVVLPDMYSSGGAGLPLAEAVDRHVTDDVRVLTALTGQQAAPGARAAAAACAAARAVLNRDALVSNADEKLPVSEFLLRETVARSQLAHYVAAYLGSTACPQPHPLGH